MNKVINKQTNNTRPATKEGTNAQPCCWEQKGWTGQKEGEGQGPTQQLFSEGHVVRCSRLRFTEVRPGVQGREFHPLL